ncbi:unnamed protein product [Adineta steineri]|uniref:Integral membrane bound transporter domain-containing protein n=1 Tax=Adineta steineri TaxID=433720 RepID=A0A813T2E2_9BILA|nr:unnamed protein product [Adineta steineri]CAF0813923.1 unnamed protein product [Adineta steineri]
MSMSTIFQNMYHFYFNYHQYDMHSVLTTSVFSRRIQFAVRMTVSFLVGSFLAYGVPFNNLLALQYLIPVMSMLSIQETFGMTIFACYQMLTAIVPISIFLYIVQKIGLGYKDYLAGELILLISSLFVAYKCSQVQNRKIALLIIAIFFSTIVNQANLPSTFIFILLELFVIGMAVAIVVSLLVFPLFATFDIENRVNYCLKNLQNMQTLVLQAFLCEDQMSAQVSLARASTIEQMIRTTMSLITARLVESTLEPSRCLQRIFNRRHRHLIDLTIQEQEDFITSLMFHTSSLQLMVKQCQFNEYHTHYARELRATLVHLDLCQTTVISSLLSSTAINRDEFNGRLADLKQALDTLRQVSIKARLHQVEHVLESGLTIRSEDHLSHAFFFYQIATIARILMRVTTGDENKSFFQEIKDQRKKKQKKKRRTLVEWLKPQWPRFVSAFKSMVIIGVGSLFVMVPGLAKVFENGQWILIALCMTQGDTVGGALTTMKMRLVGTLFGAMWAYITYLAVSDNVYHTFGMLVPWILFFGYLKPLPQWGYAATVACFTPVLITLGRIPYGDTLPAGNYALLRIEENLIGIAVAVVLTIAIFPVFAIDVLKNNIDTTLQLCRGSINAMHAIYDKLFENEQLDVTIVDVEKQNEQGIKSFIDAQRSRFHQLISGQRALIGHTALEPTLWWSKNSFASDRYSMLAEQQIDMFRMLHNIDHILLRIHECSNTSENHIKRLQLYADGGFLPASLHNELRNLSRQLSDCVGLWSSYFTLTQTRFYRIFRNFSFKRTKLNESDLSKHTQYLIELNQTIYRLQNQHQESVNRLLDHYLTCLTQGEALSDFIPYADNMNVYIIFMGIAALYYSTTQLARNALALGTNIHTIFELETTTLYRPF